MNNKLTLTALAIAAVGVGIATSAPARASGNLMDRCGNDNSRYVIEKCCNTWTRQRGKPFWFGETGTCKNVVYCIAPSRTLTFSAVAYVPKCKIVMPLPAGGGSSGGGSGPGGKPPTNPLTGTVALTHG